MMLIFLNGEIKIGWFLQYYLKLEIHLRASIKCLFFITRMNNMKINQQKTTNTTITDKYNYNR